MKSEKLPYKSDWSFELLEIYDEAISKKAREFNLDTYPIQLEIISYEQMIDAYSSAGMPTCYNHWSFGKHFLNMEKQYRAGNASLAYEIVINSTPCIAYLMDENPLTMQAVVIAHACYGHNSFFKNNYLFKDFTHADRIIDYFVYAKKFISECEEKHGLDAVEDVVDAAHALMNYGVDKYHDDTKSANDPTENVLHFIQTHSPVLEDWQKEIIDIVKRIAQYFYPQKLTKLMNEGWATFWHYTILNSMYDDGLLADEFMMGFLQAHTGVANQLPYDDPKYPGLNPYTLGFKMFQEIRRVAENPTDEDREWFPEIAGTDWIKALDFAMRNFKDESFITQYLTPNLIREMKLFTVLDDDKNEDLVISAIHNDAGYKLVRESLAEQFSLNNTEPSVSILGADMEGDRSLVLRHQLCDRRTLAESAEVILEYIHRLWGYPVKLESVDEDGEVKAVYGVPGVDGR